MTPLQWGRVLMNAETHRGITTPTLKIRLQWGRVLMNAETVRPCHGEHLSRQASMGPRSHERGKLQGRAADEKRAYSASMGPRSHERGNVGSWLSGLFDSERFNGAAFS